MNNYDFLQYMSYIISSAKGCLKEPKIYGPFRIVDSIEVLINLLEKNNINVDNEIKTIAKNIHNKKLSFMEDENEFVQMLDEVTIDIIEAINN